MIRISLIGKLASAFLLLGASASHAAIVYISDDRYIENTSSITGPVTPSPAFSDFDASFTAFSGDSGVAQISTLTSSNMSGSGTAFDRNPGGDGVESYSVFDVTFTVDQDTDISLTGTIETHWFLPSTIGVSLQIVGQSQNYFSFGDGDVNSQGVSAYSFQDRLTPGNTYHLVLFSYADESGPYDMNWSLNLDAVPAVPVPAAAWIMLSGLLTLIGVSRRRANG